MKSNNPFGDFYDGDTFAGFGELIGRHRARRD
jgi:hypothetical protein